MMIVKILGRSKSFNGVRYNTDKIKKNKGELLKARNFGALKQLGNARPQDYINYLKAWSSSSKQIRFPQLHVAISAKGQSYDKQQLAEIAEAWLKEMGYGENPYLLIFHKDTRNNHIHLVSSRIGKNGKKISDSYEKIRSYKALDKVMGTDRKDTLQTDLDASLLYNFSTAAQWMMLMEAKDYAVRTKDNTYELIKFGSVLDKIPSDLIRQRIDSRQKDPERARQLRAIFTKYRTLYSPALVEEKEEEKQGYTSELCRFLSKSFGIEIFFHAKAGLHPYGYTVIDHAGKQIFKGGEILPLDEFLGQASERQDERISNDDNHTIGIVLDDQPEFVKASARSSYHPNIYIASDIDDDQIHGPARKRKRKARTNTR